MEPTGGAFERLCEEEWPIVMRTAYLITGDRSEAEDLAQEALVRAYEHWSTVAALDKPQAWLQRVVVNLSLSWRRRLDVRRRAVPERHAPMEQMPVDHDLVEAVRALPPAMRAAIVLRYFADQSIEEVASALGRRPGTIRALTAQGVARLRDLEPGQLGEVLDEDPR
jgi:RNA polymerase sigma-70 factor (sigma-E family)